MKCEYSARACSVLYNILKSNQIKGKVLMPSNICESVPATYYLLGIQPLFCDISLDDFQIEKAKAMEIIRDESISVLHYNHTYGFISEEDTLFLKQIKKMYPDILIVDDRCLCFPEIDLVNIDADIVLYSTGPLKCVDLGWGGYAIFKDYLKYVECKINYNPSDKDKFEKHIKECHLEKIPIKKEILLSNWLEVSGVFEGNYFCTIKKKSKESYEYKQRLNGIYEEIPGGLPISYCGWRYQLLLENAKECIDSIFAAGLFCSFHYKSLGNGYFSDVVTPNSDYLEGHVVNLFNDYRFSIEQARETADILRKVAIPIAR